jgi:hypothetical protein
MLSNDLRRLEKTFDDWCHGRDFPTVDTWAAFRSDLKTCVAKAALLELGIPVNVLDIAAECAKPNTNIMLFPTPEQRQQRHDSGGAA